MGKVQVWRWRAVAEQLIGQARADRRGIMLAGAILLGLAGWGFGSGWWSKIGDLRVTDAVILAFVVLYLGIFLQAALTLYWSIYAWNDPEEVEKNMAPKEYKPPVKSFTALLPARHEEKVIGDTIKAIADIDYPEDKKELLVLIRGDDDKTIAAAREVIGQINGKDIRLVIVEDTPVNKPNQLNWGLAEAKNGVIVVFDAEDWPSREIYNIANTVMLDKKADVVQCGVQLMNFDSSWFAKFNVLEYYFWFKSAMHFFAKMGVVPLGGNTVFFERKWIAKAGGWNERCLTEDAEIGMRLSQAGARFAVVYDEKHTTREETPPDLKTFVRQRTRWNLGFLQIFWAGTWLRFGKLHQKMLAGYILLLPVIVAVMVVISPVVTVLANAARLPLGIVWFSYLPLGLLVIQLVVLEIGLWQFTRDYGLRYPWLTPIKLAAGFVPYIGLLTFSALRAVWRMLGRNLAWEKTKHVNAHRVLGK